LAELRETVAKLRESEQQLRLVTDNAPVGIVHWDAELRYKFLNKYHARRLEKLLGLTPEQVIGKRLPEVLGDKLFAVLEPYIWECLAGKSVEFEVEMPFEAADSRYLHARLEPEWRDGKVVGLVAAGTDVTNLKRTEAALRESEATFRAMFDSSAVGKIEIEVPTGRFLRANAAMCRLVGYSEEELLKLTVFDITHPDERDGDRESLRSMDAGMLPVFDREKRYIRKNGKSIWARVTANTILNEAGQPARNTAVIQDISDRKRAEQDLEASRTRLQLALDAAHLGWFQYDPLRRSGRADERFKEIFGFVSDDIPLDTLMEQVHSDDREKARSSLTSWLDPTDTKPTVVEFRVRRPDGEVRWVEIHGLATFEGEGAARGAVSLIGTAQDITERKEHEEKEHLLMREINHRAKNMLSVVHAIAKQTAAEKPEDFVERFSERIQALSANQELLVRNEWRGVDVGDLVRTQLSHFTDLIGSRIVVDGSKVRLNPASAQAIGLALHELATNAGKHGALSTVKGRIDIGWRVTNDDKFNMSWTEHGGPQISAPKRHGFGTTVIKSMAERTLDGQVHLDFLPSGVAWHLTCPAANALES
jgi:PAS domain S-box-containing protein